ncbi:DUF4214 domain-containing protein [Devosia sp. 1635]|uniref:DUF4214 domain-containing protein n=1 Tax=Devosia sp. 1635 TaxID=2726066 RepID=UPI0015675B92|nr:DUF4214 domain-containing protein [Devosia sp. 1635]
MATIQEVYIALFGRPADPVGYQYYVDATDDGANLDAVSDLSNSPEYTARFEGQSEIDMVNQIYMDLFGRPADAEGLLFYVALLQSGDASVQDIAIRILDGATGTDEDVIENKVEAAQQFTDSLDTAEEIRAYQGDEAAEAGRNYLRGVTADDATVPSEEETDAAIADIVTNAPEGPIGDTFTLTADVGEQIVGTSLADTFNAPAGTINEFDSIQGGAGEDTLNVVVGATFDVPDTASITGVENINLLVTAAGATIDAEDFEGATTFRQSGAAAVAISGLVNGQSVEFTDATATVTYDEDATEAEIELDEIDTGATLNVNGVDLTSLTVSGSVEEAAGGAASTLTITTTNEAAAVPAVVGPPPVAAQPAVDGSEIETVTINLESDVSLTVSDLTETVTFDASGSTGAITTTLTALVDLESASFGSGDDVVTYASTGATAEEVEFDLGDGEDTFAFTGANNVADTTISITLGEGNDLFDLNGLTNVTDASDFEADLITLEDFDADEDELDFTGVGAGYDELSNIEVGQVEDATTLEEALDIVSTYTAVGEYTIFDFGNDAYVYFNAAAAAGGPATDTLSAGDGVLKIVGFSVDDLDSQNFTA